MQATDRITLVLRAKEGETLEQVLPFVQLGAPVSIGRGLAVIAGASDEDLQAVIEELQSAPQNIPKIIPANWNDKQVLDFCSVALRHVVVEGDLKFSDINDALRYMADKGEPAFLAAFSIDDHVRMVADARRYRWLRDGALGTGSANVPMVRIGMGEPVGGADLDLVVDAAALNWPMLDEFDEEVVA